MSFCLFFEFLSQVILSRNKGLLNGQILTIRCVSTGYTQRSNMEEWSREFSGWKGPHSPPHLPLLVLSSRAGTGQKLQQNWAPVAKTETSAWIPGVINNWFRDWVQLRWKWKLECRPESQGPASGWVASGNGPCADLLISSAHFMCMVCFTLPNKLIMETLKDFQRESYY